MNKNLFEKHKKFIDWVKNNVPLKDFSKLKDLESIEKDFSKFSEFSVMDKESVKYIAIHHAEIDDGNVEYYNWLHKAYFGWEAIGYHFVIGNGKNNLSVDGMVEKGRDLKYAGAHVKNHNHESIGICLVGNFDKYKPTVKQYESLLKLITELLQKFDIDINNIRGHNEFEGVTKSCPGKKFNMKKLREDIKSILEA